MTLSVARHSQTPDAEWFASWFDSFHYRKLYAHRDEAEAHGLVDALVSRLDLSLGAAVVDVGCGTGRHARRLASWGFQVTGLDLAETSIQEARLFDGRRLRFRRHDMRRPFGRCAFDAVFSFFTSFGYFDDLADHLAVVRNMADAVKPGGHLVLDYLNDGYASSHLMPAETKTIDGAVYRITRWSDDRHFFKRIAIEDASLRAPIEYREQVARFTFEDFQRMFARHGVDIVARYGDYALGPYDAATSPRLVLIGRKREPFDMTAHLRDNCLRMRLSVSGVSPR